jgi:hypothetical protein
MYCILSKKYNALTTTAVPTDVAQSSASELDDAD